MKFNSLSLLALMLLIVAPTVNAQEVIIPQPTDFTFGAEPNNGQPFYPSDVGFNSSTGETQLTAATPRSTVARAFMYPKFNFCAEDYLITYEASIKGTIPTSGEIRVGTFYNKDIKDAQTIVELDTFQDGGPSMPYGRHEINNNHIAVETQLGTVNGGFDLKAGWDTATASVEEPPFLIANSGTEWIQVQIRNNKGDVTVDAVKGLKYLKLFAKSEFRANTPVFLSLEGSTRPSSTGYSTPQQRIKNLKIHILKSCTNQKTASEVLAELDPTHSLDNCPISDLAITQASSNLLKLKNDGILNQSLYEEVLNLVSNKLNFCNGLNQCKVDLEAEKQIAYQRGYLDGAISIDQEAIKKVAFDSGAASIDQTAIKTTAYTSGYTNGVASVPVDSIKAESYKLGFDTGKASVQCPINGGGSQTDANKKVTICHHSSNDKTNTLEISKSALASHQKHGDTVGACPIVDKVKEGKTKVSKK